MLTRDCLPGPSVAFPVFSPSSSTIGPLRSKIGASGLVDISHWRARDPILRTASHAAISTGRWDGSHPAIAADTAIFSTVATPIPGGNSPTTCSGARVVPASILPTRSGVGGISGSPSPQPLSRNVSLNPASASNWSDPLNVSGPPGSRSGTGPSSSGCGSASGSVSPRTTASIRSAMLAAERSGGTLVITSGTTTNGARGMPNTRALAIVSRSNPADATDTVGIPFRSR